MTLKEQLTLFLNCIPPERENSPCCCKDCDKLTKETDFECEVCGYKGTPDTFGCECYDYHCSPFGRGSGCPHGGLTCPSCEDGEGNMEPWEWIRRIRRLVEDAP